MPQLDVSEVLTDPDFATTFMVTRRSQTVNSLGRKVDASTTYNNVVGVICMASPNDLMRLDDQDRTGKVISLITKWRLRSAAEGASPDLVTWMGDQYIVTWRDQYTHYGQGQVQTLCKLFKQSQAHPTGQLPYTLAVVLPVAAAEVEEGDTVTVAANNLGHWDMVAIYVWLTADDMPEVPTGVGTYDADTNTWMLDVPGLALGAYSVVAVGSVLGGTVASPAVAFTIVPPF